MTETNTKPATNNPAPVKEPSTEALIALTKDTDNMATTVALSELVGFSPVTINKRFAEAGLEPAARVASGNKGRPAFLFDRDMALDAILGSGVEPVEVGTPAEQAAAEAVLAE